jgi:hypothetical protein
MKSGFGFDGVRSSRMGINELDDLAQKKAQGAEKMRDQGRETTLNYPKLSWKSTTYKGLARHKETKSTKSSKGIELVQQPQSSWCALLA